VCIQAGIVAKRGKGSMIFLRKNSVPPTLILMELSLFLESQVHFWPIHFQMLARLTLKLAMNSSVDRNRAHSVRRDWNDLQGRVRDDLR
jgi:hypothetical protein